MSDCRFGVSPVNYPDPDPEKTDDIETWYAASGAQVLPSLYK